MSLTVYNKKRNFNRTPEPAPIKSDRKKKRLTFVVQKHDATRLHYDFRLEMYGVLKSWAIPKGPSTVPGEKRLAVMVEDHPLKYGRFYGEIPEGNYGAGIVEIWDEGTYTSSFESADPENNLFEMLQNGDIKFTLNGTYLKGRFALFKLKNTEKDNEWMLVKKADEFAGETFDISSISALKSKNISKKKKNKNKIKITDPFPDLLPIPMAAKLTGEVVDHPSWIYEMKLDGYRMICSVKEGKVELASRNGNSYTRKFKVLIEDLKMIEENLILDGEVVIENSKGISDFQLLQNYIKSGKGVLRYYIFDILYMEGHNIMNFTLLKRKEILDALFNKYEFTNVIKLKFQTGKGKELFGKLSGEGYEGIIAKDPESTYLPGKRVDTWLKIKSVQTQEAVICGYTEPQGSRKYFGSLILGVYENKILKYIGNCGTGFSEASLKDLYGIFESLKTDKCCFSTPPELSWTKGKPIWMKPRLVANIKFMEWSDEEIMRNPVFMGLREDKDPQEVANEMKAEQKFKAENVDSLAGRDKSLPGKNLKLTNISKIYWESEGYTKGDLIAYYQNISGVIMPYLKDRPQSLNRHPHGITGENFFQKDMDTDHIPDWIKTSKMESKTSAQGINYLICNNVETLVYMINLGCIEINPWHSTYRKPDFPSYMMLDLDPGEIPFKAVVDAALVIKELCDEIKIPCYCKTSGATGLHIYIPLAAKYNYDQSRTFAEILAVIVQGRLPSTTSIERTVSKRKDKIYIDFLQNRRGQTIVAPYCVRPRAMATVSAPLSWNEVNHQLSPEMFTIKNMEKRIKKVGDLWEPVLSKGISISLALKAIEKL